MSYIEQSLAGGEALKYRGHFHWLHKAAGWITLILLVGFGLAGYLNERYALAAIMSGLGLILFLLIMYPIWSQQIAITSERLIYRRGIISRSTEELRLNAIEEVQVEQSILGRLLDYGEIVITGTGEQSIELPVLADPIGLRQNLQQAQMDRDDSAPRTAA